MKKKKDPHLNLIALTNKKRMAGLSNLKQLVEETKPLVDGLETINVRISKIMEIISKNKKNLKSVYVYVIYDISDSKIRTYVSTYLERNGLVRVQLSVFFGNIKRELYLKIQQTLKEINDMYTNKDSIFIIPIGEDILNKTTIIGENIDFDIIVHHKATLFI
jgi:CRISPR-associated endonuclease Cas2